MYEQEKATRYGKCRIEREIGRGAGSVVYLARHEAFDIRVAVKVVNKGTEGLGDSYGKRVMREAHIAAQLTHPGIVRIYDCGETEDSYYLVLEYIEGRTCLQQIEEQGPFEWQRAVQIIREVADGLRYAYESGVIHRDLKPQNIMIDSHGNARIADMGLAKAFVLGKASATLDGEVLGTPYYMSPEQVRHPAEVDFRADIYSLGATLYHLTTGVPPFEAATPFEVMAKHLNASLASPREKKPELPELLCDVVIRAMAKKPVDRYQSYGDLIGELDRLLTPETEPEVQISHEKELPAEQVRAVGVQVETPPVGGRAEEQLAEEVQAVEAEAEVREPLPELPPVLPQEIPITEQNLQAKLKGLLALLACAFFLVCMYHVLMGWAGVAAAVATTAAVLVLSAGCSYLVFRRGSPGAKTEALEGLQNRLEAGLKRVCERLALPKPHVWVSRWLDNACFAYSLSSRKASIHISRAWLCEANLTVEELEALMTQCVGSIYCADSEIRTLLAGPVELLRIVRLVARKVLNIFSFLSPGRMLWWSQGVTVAGMAGIVAFVVLLFWISIWGGLIGLLFLAVLMLVAAFERASCHAADAFAAKLSDSEDIARFLVALSVLTFGDFYRLHLYYEWLSKAGEYPSQRPQNDTRQLAERVVSHFSEVRYAPGLLERVRALLSPVPFAAERINRLAGVVRSRPSIGAAAHSLERIYANLSGGEQAEPINMQELAAFGFYQAVGAIAGGVAVAALALLSQLGLAHYAGYLALVSFLAIVSGFLIAAKTIRRAASAGTFGWAIIVTSVFFMCTSMLGLCLFGGANLSHFALHSPASLVLFGFFAFLVGALSVRLCSALRIKRRHTADGARAEEDHARKMPAHENDLGQGKQAPEGLSDSAESQDLREDASHQE